MIGQGPVGISGGASAVHRAGLGVGLGNGSEMPSHVSRSARLAADGEQNPSREAVADPRLPNAEDAGQSDPIGSGSKRSPLLVDEPSQYPPRGGNGLGTPSSSG